MAASRFLASSRVSASGENAIGNDPDERQLGKRTGGPPSLGVTAEPTHGPFMSDVGGPCQGDQDVHIKESSSHSISSKSFLTSSVVTAGESDDRTTRWKLFTTFVGRGLASTRRTKSETALPMETPRHSASLVQARRFRVRRHEHQRANCATYARPANNECKSSVNW